MLLCYVTGDVSYMYLHIQSKEHGLLTLELDDIPCPPLEKGGSDGMIAGGLEYRCLKPMEEWAIRFDGLMETGYNKDKIETDPTMEGHHFPVEEPSRRRHVSLDITFIADTEPFRYHQDDSRCLDTLLKPSRHNIHRGS